MPVERTIGRFWGQVNRKFCLRLFTTCGYGPWPPELGGTNLEEIAVRRYLLIIAALAVSVPMLAFGKNSWSSAEEQEHCIAVVLGQNDDGEFVLSEPECTTGSFDSLAASVGVGQWASEGEVAAGARYATLARHWEGSNYSGSSLSIAGSSCSGGWLNLPSNWVNRINSTVTYGSGCDRVKHFDSYALSGSYQSTWPNGNLSYMIDRANSVQYL